MNIVTNRQVRHLHGLGQPIDTSSADYLTSFATPSPYISEETGIDYTPGGAAIQSNAPMTFVDPTTGMITLPSGQQVQGAIPSTVPSSSPAMTPSAGSAYNVNVSLPVGLPPGASPRISCPTGYTVNPAGQCVAPTANPSMPSWVLLLAGGIGLLLILAPSGKRR
jgi:hypothetical protein